MIFESLSGRFGSSPSTIFLIRCLIVTDETCSPYELLIPLWKKNFISYTPAECAFVVDDARHSIRASRCRSRHREHEAAVLDPVVEEPCWKLMMLVATLTIVFCRWSTDFSSHSADLNLS